MQKELVRRKVNSSRGAKMKKKILAVFGLLFSIALLTACGSGTAAEATPTTTATTAPVVVVNQPRPVKTATRFPTMMPNAVFQIVTPGGAVVPVTLAGLKGLPQTQITVQGKTAEGPKLKDVLTLAGIISFNQVSLTGNGNLIVTLTSDQVTDETIIDLTYHGVVRLASPDLSKLQWVQGITKIVVK
jgi:hypothetical protein